ncbi:MAG TPA: polysaccharide deacetylase family protein [Candidatus Deferrimicrobiaceae bacterium]|jgi:peptidoglycan/xylan/chitin deacetylase (PgdA/CDA1 family)
MKRLIKYNISVLVYLYDRLVKIIGRRNHSFSIVILYYHSVPDAQRSMFSRQMESLARSFHPISIQNLNRPEPGKHHVLVTFDDGFTSVSRNVLPETRARNIPIALFVPTGHIGKAAGWLKGSSRAEAGESVMTPQEIRKISQDGLVEIGSHCVSHSNLLTLSLEGATSEIIESKQVLEKILEAPVDTISFPHGAYSSEHLSTAVSAGYKIMFGIDPTLETKNRLGVPLGRVAVEPTDWPFEFRMKASGAYRWLPAVFSIKKTIRNLGRS